MGIADGEIVACHPERKEVVEKLLETMVDEASEIVTIMYGKDVDKQEIDGLIKKLEKHRSLEVETIDGGQDIYSYIISIE
jgi:hypothetical protein